MKNKCVCALIFCTILTNCILTSCGNPAASEISRMVNSSLLAIDAESDPDQILEGDPAPWEPLAENTACNSLRTAIDRCLGIEVSGEYKNGVLYVNPADKSWNAKLLNLQRSFLISLLCYYKYVRINIILQTKLHRENDNRWSNFYSKDIT